jgi:hypothetical protein
MPRKVNTYTRFLPLTAGNTQNVIVKNECYFSLIFLGGNYFSRGNILQKIFGGRDEVALIAGLRLPPDGVVLVATEEPNIVLDKRSIKPGQATNIPLVLNMLVNIPAYMESIGFSFKVATVARKDNFSAALDVLNETANKGIIDTFIPTSVGKLLGVGKIVKDVFDKIDAANNREMIQLAINDFLIPSSASSTEGNIFQEGYLVIFVKNEEPEEEMSDATATEKKTAKSKRNISNKFHFDDGFNNIRELTAGQTTFLDIEQMEEQALATGVAAALAPAKLEYDEATKILKADGKPVTNTYIVFKVKKEGQRSENESASWSKKFVAAVNVLAFEFIKTKDKLKELEPKVLQALSEGAALLAEDNSFTRKDKAEFVKRYIAQIDEEKVKFV